MKNPLDAATALLGGLEKTAAVCGVSFVSVHKWIKRGRLPRTEWTGETHYAEKIEAATGGAITKAELLSYVPSPKP